MITMLPSQDRETAFDWAIRNDHTEIAEILRHHTSQTKRMEVSSHTHICYYVSIETIKFKATAPCDLFISYGSLYGVDIFVQGRSANTATNSEKVPVIVSLNCLTYLSQSLIVIIDICYIY